MLGEKLFMIKIKVQNLSFSYDKEQVLHNINLLIKEHTINVFLGLNGSGKTTLIKLLTGIIKSPKESIYINDKDIVDYSFYELSKIISYVPQLIVDDNDFPVLDYLSFGRMNTIKFYSAPKNEDYDKVKMVAKELCIDNLLSKKMNELSGGQRQLVVIARAVIQDSQIIIMDEPTSAIDYYYLNKIIRYLHTLLQRGKTIILSCHNPSLPLLSNANIVVLEKGSVYICGNAREKLSLPILRDIYKCNLIPCSELPYQEISLYPVDYEI